VVVNNSVGTATSSAAVLTVNPAPVAPSIVSQPVNQAVVEGGNVSFSVTANGTAPLTYQWRRNGANLAGATSATLNLTGVTTNQAGSYTVVVNNSVGTATSSAAVLTVNPAPVAPSIVSQPVSQTVVEGDNVSFSVTANGTAPLTYQWRRNGSNLNGATSATLNLTGVTTNQAGNYTVVVNNSVGTATSSAAVLTVTPAPVAPSIVSQPVSQAVVEGGNVSFSVTANGSAPLTYQWRRNGANLNGATSATLNLTGVTTNQAGNYTVVVNNSVGSATSSAAVLTVNPAPPLTAQLSVTKTGQGTVTPDLNSTPLVIGQSYTVTATPATGYVFSGWTGSIISSAPTLTFVMTSNLVLQANFTATPYTAASATYNGLFNESDAVRVNSAGAFNVYADTGGNYSGWVQLGFARYSISGKLDLNLHATNVITRYGATSLTVELRIGQGAQAGQAYGRVTDGTWNSPLTGGRSTGNSPYAGDYTLVIPGLVGDAQIPAGDGYATLHVGADGMATMNGTLADGSQFVQSAYVTDDGDWPVYVSLYAAKGALVSWISFADLASSDASGNLVWIKQAGASATSYPAGFTSETKAVGSRYVAPTAQGKAVNLSGAVVSFSGGELSASFNNVVSVNVGSQVVNLSPNALSFNIATGLGTFSGTVQDPANGVIHNFGGVVLQKLNAGYGLMTGANASSRVVLAAP